MKEKNDIHHGFCCWGGNKGFPTFAVILLAIGVLWLLQELKVIAVGFSWWPVIIIIVALGWIIDNYKKR